MEEHAGERFPQQRDAGLARHIGADDGRECPPRRLSVVRNRRRGGAALFRQWRGTCRAGGIAGGDVRHRRRHHRNRAVPRRTDHLAQLVPDRRRAFLHALPRQQSRHFRRDGRHRIPPRDGAIWRRHVDAGHGRAAGQPARFRHPFRAGLHHVQRHRHRQGTALFGFDRARRTVLLYRTGTAQMPGRRRHHAARRVRHHHCLCRARRELSSGSWAT